MPTPAEIFFGSEVDCLTDNAFFEARNQGPDGVVAVIRNTLYRASLNYRGADTVCSVVYHPGQYSWVWDDIPDVVKDSEIEVYDMIQAFAKDYVMDFYGDRLRSYQIGSCKRGADHYHAHYVTPYWADKTKVCGQIGDHIFYNL